MSTGGRPPLYTDPLVFEERVEQYFDKIRAADGVPTIAGLAFELGFCSRGTLWEYQKKDGFSDTIKRAKLRIEVDRTEKLVSAGTPTAGLIFDLCNNFGYKNPQHHKHSGDEEGSPVRMVMSSKPMTDEEWQEEHG